MNAREAALERAGRFVEAQGGVLARARARALLGVESADAARARLVESGSGASGVAASLRTLAVLDELEALDSQEAARVAAALEPAQDADGSWASAPGQDEAPRIVLTGLLGGFLARTPAARQRVLDAAGAFLGARFAPAQLGGGAYGPLVAFAHFFSNVAHEQADVALQWCGRELERAFRTRRLGALRVARVLSLCDAEALPGARLEAAELVAALLAAQASDGGFDAGEPSSREARVESTLEAMLALRRLDRRACPLAPPACGVSESRSG